MKSAKSTYLYAIAAYMLTQLCVLLFAFGFSGNIHPMAMHAYGMFPHDFSMSFRGGMDVMPIFLSWALGTVLFAFIFALFLFPGSWRRPAFAARARQEPAAAEASAFEEVSDEETGAGGTAAGTQQTRVYAVGSDDGTGLGIAALIAGVIGFVPGFGLVFSIIGLICGLIGSMRAGAAGNAAGRSLSLIGIVLSAISLALTVITVFVLGSAIGMVMSFF